MSWSCGLDLGLKLNSNSESEFYGLFQVYLILIYFSLAHIGGVPSSVYLRGAKYIQESVFVFKFSVFGKSLPYSILLAIQNVSILYKKCIGPIIYMK